MVVFLYLQESALFPKEKVDVFPLYSKGFASTFFVLKNHVSVLVRFYIRFWSSFFLEFPTGITMDFPHFLYSAYAVSCLASGKAASEAECCSYYVL